MNDKLTAGLVAAVVAAPLCAICIFGLAAVGSAFAWLVAEIGGFGVWATASVFVVAAAIVYGLLRWQRVRMGRTGPTQDPEERTTRIKGST